MKDRRERIGIHIRMEPEGRAADEASSDVETRSSRDQAAIEAQGGQECRAGQVEGVSGFRYPRRKECWRKMAVAGPRRMDACGLISVHNAAAPSLRMPSIDFYGPTHV